MKNNHLEKGRVNQKLQTRFEILSATKRLTRKSQKVTMDDVAREAGMSRATIYRYFSNIDVLILEASLDYHHKTPEELSKEVESMSLLKTLHFIQNHYNRHSQENEIMFRRYMSAFLAASITSKKSLRGARRVKALHLALTRFKNQMDAKVYNRLIYVSSVLMGIDAQIVCKDVCKLNNQESNAVLQWGVEMILKGISASHSSPHQI